MKLGRLSVVALVVSFAALLLLMGTVSADAPAGSAVTAAITPIPDEGQTNLPKYIGKPANRQPLPAVLFPPAPQNPYLAPNPSGSAHNDTWMSDTYDIAGPLGRTPVTWSSNLAAALKPDAKPPYPFQCGLPAFDRYGRIVSVCTGW